MNQDIRKKDSVDIPLQEMIEDSNQIEKFTI